MRQPATCSFLPCLLASLPPYLPASLLPYSNSAITLTCQNEEKQIESGQVSDEEHDQRREGDTHHEEVVKLRIVMVVVGGV